MQDLIISLIPIIGLLLVATTAAVFVHIQSPGRNVVKWLVVPAALCALLASPILFVQLMGYSVALPLPDKFIFLAYNPVIEKGLKTGLEIWISDGSTTRLQKAPYSKELEEVLDEAAKGQKGGRKAHISKKSGEGKEPKQGQEQIESEYELKFHSPSDVAKD